MKHSANQILESGGEASGRKMSFTTSVTSSASSSGKISCSDVGTIRLFLAF
jgi:hypothetical protein